jgi:tetratricopeptide (TPR) repeat protein
LSLASDRAYLPALQTRVIEDAGLLAFHQSDYAQARSYFNECLALNCLLEDETETAFALNALGLVAWHLGDYEQATTQFAQGLQF